MNRSAARDLCALLGLVQGLVQLSTELNRSAARDLCALLGLVQGLVQLTTELNRSMFACALLVPCLSANGSACSSQEK